MSGATQSRRDVTIVYAALIIASMIALYPLLSIAMLAFQEPGTRVHGFTIPRSLHFDNFVTAWNTGMFDKALVSSIIVAATVVVVAVGLSTLAGFSFAYLPVPFKKLLFAVLLIGLVLPSEAIVIPMYYNFDNLGLLDSRWALIIPQVGLSVSFGTLWMRVSFENQPPSLLEAARLDGASDRQAFARVLAPLAAGPALTLASLLFLFTWNEFLLALILVPRNQDAQTAPLALSLVAGNRRTGDPAVTAAAALIVAMPVLAVFAVLQRRFVRGFATGASK